MIGMMASFCQEASERVLNARLFLPPVAFGRSRGPFHGMPSRRNLLGDPQGARYPALDIPAMELEGHRCGRLNMESVRP
jgi:hypothetical protein